MAQSGQAGSVYRLLWFVRCHRIRGYLSTSSRIEGRYAPLDYCTSEIVPPPSHLPFDALRRSMLASFSEGLLLGQAAGLSPETILEVITLANFSKPSIQDLWPKEESQSIPVNYKANRDSDRSKVEGARSLLVNAFDGAQGLAP